MTMRQFVQKEKREIDLYIKKKCPQVQLNDSEREAWILNDYSLYNWALLAGVAL